MQQKFTLKKFGGSLRHAILLVSAVVLCLWQNKASAQYCVPGQTLSSSYYINNFATTGGFVNISNLNSGFSSGGYGNFSATQIVSQNPGSSVNFTGSFATSAGTFGARVWVDWNQDNDFDDPGETVFQTSSYVSSISGTITVPATAVIGNTRMRVGCHWLSSTGPTPCLTGNQYTEFEDYTFTVVALVSCSSVTFPSSATTQASPSSLCMSGNVTLGITPSTAMPPASGITYQWQSAPSATGPWTNIGTPTATASYTATGVTATSYFRCQVLCNASTTVLTSSASSAVVVNNPGTPTVTGATRCGPGAVTLGATPPAGSSINWYAAPTGGAPLQIGGTTYNTGYIPATTTFYAAATAGSSVSTQWVGTGTTTTTSPPNPYYTTFYGNKEQFLIRASEMIAAGLSAGTINSIGFDVTSISSPPALSQYRISMKNTSSTALTTTWETGLTPALNPTTYTIVANSVNTHTLNTPFYWDGASNLLIEVCFNNTVWTGSTNIKYASYGYAASHYQYDDNSNQCASPTGTNSTSTNRPNIQFNMTLGCVGTRVPVVATVTPPPALTKTSPAIVCSDAVGTFQVTSPVGQYSNYAWTPATELYTDPAGTVPYVSGASAPTVYFRSPTAGSRSFYLYATNTAAPNCAFADTVRTWVQPDSVYIKALPDTICISGSTMLLLVPGSGYAPNGIQWQSSADGVNYTDITGQTGTSYMTPTLTSNTYYRARIKSNGATSCEMPVKYVVVANPSLISVDDSFNCGPGTVTLQAVSGGNSGIKWYNSPTSTSPLASGGTFVTPYLGTTTTYYVAASSGTPQPPPTIIGTGTSATSGTFLPYYRGYYGCKVQWVITAAEMQAAGFTAGLITSLGFNVVSAGSAVSNMTLSLKNTTLTTLTAPFQTNMQQVYSVASYTPVAGMNVHNFQVPFEWDGVSNIVVEECHNNTNTGTSSTVTYLYNYPALSCLYNYANVANHCTTPGGTTYASNYRPNMRIGMLGACESPRQAVVAHIYPTPLVDLGPDINKCVDEGAVEVLDAGYQPNTPQYLWDNGSTSQVRAVSQSGSYWAKVTNQYTCVGEDTIMVTLRDNPVVHLGNDTTVCNGVTLTLNAGNQGIDYFWNTGATTQTINVNSPGTYNVFVTNSQGCTKVDTIVVNMAGELPSIQGIQVSNNGQYTFHFTAVNPQNVIGYEWDFGDSSPLSYQASPYHTYANNGNYIVTLRLSSTCGFYVDSSSAHIVGIHQLNVSNDELTVFPNPSRGTATILNKGDLKMEKIQIYNVVGQVIYEAKADSKDKHTLDLGGMASGVYTIEVFTDKGTVPRKLEILK